MSIASELLPAGLEKRVSIETLQNRYYELFDKDSPKDWQWIAERLGPEEMFYFYEEELDEDTDPDAFLASPQFRRAKAEYELASVAEYIELAAEQAEMLHKQTSAGDCVTLPDDLKRFGRGVERLTKTLGRLKEEARRNGRLLADLEEDAHTGGRLLAAIVEPKVSTSAKLVCQPAKA